MTLARMLAVTATVVTSALPGQTPPRASESRPATRSAPAKPVRAEKLPSKVDYVPVGRYDELRSFVVRSGATGGTLFNSPDGQANYVLVLRTKESQVEEHSRWDDLVITRAGSGSIEVGRTTRGARFLAAGELRGGVIASPSRLALRPGDIARIPAGVPHAFVPNGSEPWEFVIIKVRRSNKPLKRPPNSAK